MKSQEILAKAQQKAMTLGMSLLDCHKAKKIQEGLLNELEMLEKEFQEEIQKEKIEAEKAKAESAEAK